MNSEPKRNFVTRVANLKGTTTVIFAKYINKTRA